MGSGIRPTGLDNAAAALRYYERRQEVVANNLANVNTDGFKAERAFARLMSDGSTPAIETATDFRAGPITTTGAPLDLAIVRDGFFVAQSDSGERFTRGGSLHLDDKRQLVDQGGHPLLAEPDAAGNGGGPIVIPANAQSITINESGLVSADGKELGRLRVENVPAGTRLQHDAGGLFIPGTARQRIAPADRSIRQGAREESNVGSITALVDMIAVQRAYASVQKVLTTIDSARSIAVSELAKPN
jgi:flagellar basal-body rod protein FlgF